MRGATEGLRVRFLVKSPKIFIVDARGHEKITEGTWERVWAKTWRDYPGEKKIVSGKTIIIHLAAQEGWE